MRKASDEQQPPRLFDVVCCDGVRDMRACDVGFGAAAACVRGGVFYLLIYLANCWTESCQIWRKYLLFGAIPSIIGKELMVLKKNPAEFGRLQINQLWGESSDQIGRYFTRFFRGSFSRARESRGKNYPRRREENWRSRDTFQ